MEDKGWVNAPVEWRMPKPRVETSYDNPFVSYMRVGPIRKITPWWRFRFWLRRLIKR